MKTNKIFAVLLCSTFLMAGCNTTSNGASKAKQSFSKESLLTEPFLRQNFSSSTSGGHYAYSNTIDPTSTFSGFTIYNSTPIYGFYILYRSGMSGYEYFAYNMHKNEILLQTTDSHAYNTTSSQYVSGYVSFVGFEDNLIHVFNGLGQQLFTTSSNYNISNESYDAASNTITLRYYEYSSGVSKTLVYVPDGDVSDVTPQTNSEVGVYKGSIDCSMYGNKDYRLQLFERKCDVFHNNTYVNSYELPYRSSEAKIIGDNLIFIQDHSLTFDAKSYQYSSGYSKYNQEIYTLNYITGKRQTFSSKYYISSEIETMKDGNGFITYGKATVHEINKDKTLKENAPLTYLMDANFTFYDNITNVNFVNPIMVTTSNGVVFANSNGIVYDSNLNIVRDFSNDLTSITFSSKGKYVIGQRGGKFGIASITGFVACPFEYDNIYFDPDTAPYLIGRKDSYYYKIMNNNGSFYSTLSTIDNVTGNSNGYLVSDSGNYSLYTIDGEQAYIFESGTSINSTNAVNFDAVGLRYIAVRYTYSATTKYIFIKLTKVK